jgi:transcription initiation factor IIE alpha subunit
MILVCQACGFLFERVSRPDVCPYCEGEQLEYADAREKIAFLKRKEESLRKQKPAGKIAE